MSASPAPNRAPGGPESTGAPRPRVVLLTGFDAFGGDALNPSASLVEALDGQALDGQALDGWRVAGGLLPTVFGRSLDELHRLLDRHRPALVLCTGLAGGRPALSLERVAININDARIPDNAAAQPIDTPVVAGAPAAYFSTLPIKAMRAAIEAAGVPAEISQHRRHLRLQPRVLRPDDLVPQPARPARRIHPHPLSARAGRGASRQGQHGTG